MEKSVIIEVDSGIHHEQEEYDTAREEDLRKKGYHILRFTNDQVLNNLPKVLSTICKAPLS